VGDRIHQLFGPEYAVRSNQTKTVLSWCEGLIVNVPDAGAPAESRRGTIGAQANSHKIPSKCEIKTMSVGAKAARKVDVIINA